MLPFSSPNIPFPVWDCVAVMIWLLLRLSLSFSLCFFSFLALLLPFARISILSGGRGRMFTLWGVHNHSRWKIRATRQRRPPKKCLSQNDSQLICRPILIWWQFLKYVPRPACLSKSSKRLSVYFSTSHVPLVTALWRERSSGCRHTILSLSVLEPGTDWTLIYFSTSVLRENTLSQWCCMHSPFQPTAL